MPRPRWTQSQASLVRSKTNGKCFHCGAQLPDHRAAWHIDHHPIPYRDIESQLCCGVTDPRDMRNLVPSCPTCNTSHVAEPAGRACFCGRTQPPCTKGCFRALAGLTLLVFCSGASAAVATMLAPC